MEIFELIDIYKELLDTKEDLVLKNKSNNKKIDEIKKLLSQAMIDNECPKISRNGFTYSLQAKTIYNKKSNDELLENGLDYFDVLRQEGFGSLIKETVDSRSLSSALNNYVDENGELSPGLESIVSIYETYDISKRKETNKAIKKEAN
ncbi:MAG: hypothetical protein ACI4VF_04880 [Lachnospirales bacterium]